MPYLTDLACRRRQDQPRGDRGAGMADPGPRRDERRPRGGLPPHGDTEPHRGHALARHPDQRAPGPQRPARALRALPIRKGLRHRRRPLQPRRDGAEPVVGQQPLHRHRGRGDRHRRDLAGGADGRLRPALPRTHRSLRAERLRRARAQGGRRPAQAEDRPQLRHGRVPRPDQRARRPATPGTGPRARAEPGADTGPCACADTGSHVVLAVLAPVAAVVRGRGTERHGRGHAGRAAGRAALRAGASCLSTCPARRSTSGGTSTRCATSAATSSARSGAAERGSRAGGERAAGHAARAAGDEPSSGWSAPRTRAQARPTETRLEPGDAAEEPGARPGPRHRTGLGLLLRAVRAAAECVRRLAGCLRPDHARLLPARVHAPGQRAQRSPRRRRSATCAPASRPPPFAAASRCAVSAGSSTRSRSSSCPTTGWSTPGRWARSCTRSATTCRTSSSSSGPCRRRSRAGCARPGVPEPVAAVWVRWNREIFGDMVGCMLGGEAFVGVVDGRDRPDAGADLWLFAARRASDAVSAHVPLVRAAAADGVRRSAPPSSGGRGRSSTRPRAGRRCPRNCSPPRTARSPRSSRPSATRPSPVSAARRCVTSSSSSRATRR